MVIKKIRKLENKKKLIFLYNYLVSSILIKTLFGLDADNPQLMYLNCKNLLPFVTVI